MHGVSILCIDLCLFSVSSYAQKQQELVVKPPSVSQYMNACAQEHMCECVADALVEKGTDCQDTDNYSSYSLEEVGLALGKDTQKLVVGCDDRSKTTRHVDKGMLSVECMSMH